MNHHSRFHRVAALLALAVLLASALRLPAATPRALAAASAAPASSTVASVAAATTTTLTAASPSVTVNEGQAATNSGTYSHLGPGPLRLDVSAGFLTPTLPAYISFMPANSFTALHYWQLGEDDPGAADGVTGNATTMARFKDGATSPGNSLTRQGSPSYTAVDGSYGSVLAMSFNGSTDGYISDLLDGAPDNFGVEARVKSNSVSGPQVVAYHGTMAFNGFGILIDDAGHPGSLTYRVVYGGVTNVDTGVAVTPGTWQDVALVRDQGATKLFVDAALVYNSSIAAPNFALDEPLGIGQDPQAASNFYSGALDDVRFFFFNAGTFSAQDLAPNQSVSGAWSWNFNTSDGPAQSRNVTFTANTGVSGDRTSISIPLTVTNVAPTATFANGGSVSAGSAGRVSFSGQSDPSAADISAGLHYAYDFDNDGVFEVGGDGTYANAVTAALATVPASYLTGAGSHMVRGRIVDKDGGFTDYTTTITVNAVNHAPVAANDSYSANQGTPLTVAPPGVLANDTDADSNPLSAVKVGDPAHGTLTLNANGSFTYTPAAGYSGPDSFTYKANDGTAESNVATVSITVVSANIGLLGYWKFDEGTGTTAADSSGSVPANNGTLAGGAAFSASAAPITSFANPGALSVSAATSSKVMVPNSGINRLTNTFTVMGWVNPSTVSGIQRVISSARTTTSGNGWAFGLNNTFLQFSTYGVKDYFTTQGTGMKAGQWYHIAAVMDSSNAVSFYIDGVLVEKVTSAGPGIADTDDVLLIGARTNNGATTLTDGFNGLIDDLKIYNRALSASEIAGQVGVAPCSETVLRARVQVGENTAAKTITLDGACTYPVASVGDTANGGSGIKISSATTIEGNGATIARSASAPQMRVMVTSPAIAIRNLTVRDGNVIGNGGGLLAFGNLTLTNVRFENNTTDHPTGATSVQVGGAVSAQGNLTVDRSTFVGNKTDGYGGAINFSGLSGRVTNSVFASNSSGSPGAAINASNASGSLTLLNNTFTDAYKNPKEAVLVNGSATLKNNIFDSFLSSLTASGATALVSEDYNLLSGDTNIPQALNSAVVTSGGHDRIAASPRFVDPAAFNYHVQQNSPAIDLGVVDASVAIDADGNARPFAGTGVDIGAYEYQGIGVPSLSITKTGPAYAAAIGQTQFVLTVINESTTSLTDLRIVEQLPAGATYVAGSASDGGSFSGGTLTWNLSPLAPNQMKRVGYKVTATQNLVSNSYRVSSISNPAITASGPVLTTPYNANVTAFGFEPFPDGYSYANYKDSVDSDTTVDDMVFIFGAANVCETQNPCVLTAAAEDMRKSMTARDGGHCFGLAMSTLWIYDRADVTPGDYQPGASITYDLSKSSSRRLNQLFYYTQGAYQTTLSTTVPAYTAAKGAAAIVDKLRANFANASATDRYELSFAKPDGSAGHAVTPYAVKQVDADTYWIYVYDNNYPNNFDRVFKVTYSTNSWIYEGGATDPGAPPSTYTGSGTTQISLKSLRNVESFPKKCPFCTATTTAPVAPAFALMAAQTTALATTQTAQIASDAYTFELDGEGYLMITRSDGKRAGVDPSGQFIAEIPGAEQFDVGAGDGRNVPGVIRVPHTAGMTYSLRVTDRQNAYGNQSATANLNIFGQGFVTHLKGLKLDSPADSTTVQPGTNDVLGISFDGDNHRLAFTSSALDSDTPALSMAVSQAGAPDYSFEVGGAQMASGRTLAVAIDPATGKLTIENNDPASNTYSLDVTRLNLDGSTTTYHFNTVSDGTGVGASVDLGPSWTGSAPSIGQINAPVANADNYTTTANTPLTVTAPGVLANDTGSSPLTAVKVTNPAHGTLTFNANGSFTYTPAANYAGSDSFTYKATDGTADSNVATVTIAVKYTFSGFFGSVLNPPTLNQVNAGSNIAFIFGLGGNVGLNIFATGYPQSQQINCSTGALMGSPSPVSAALSLSYNATTGRYTYTAKTDKKWAATCRQFNLRTADGTDHFARFKFK